MKKLNPLTATLTASDAEDPCFQTVGNAALEALLISAEGTILTANSRAAELFGLASVRDLIGRDVAEFTTSACADQVQDMITKNRPDLYRARLKRADGTTFLAEIQGRRYMYQGRPARLTAIRDVTAEENFRQALRERESYYRSLIEISLDLIAVLNHRGHLVFVNPVVEDLLGYDPDRLIGKPVLGFIHPDDVAAARNAMMRAFETPTERQQSTLRLRHRDGAWRIFEIVGRGLVMTDSEETHLVIGARDVTARVRTQQTLKEREEQLDRAQRVAQMASWEINLTTDTMSGTDQLFRLFGLSPQAEISFQAIRRFFHPDDLPKIDAAFRQAQETFEPFDLIHRIVRADGRERTMHLRGDVELHGQELIMYGTAQDVTEAKYIEHQLRRSEQRFRAIFNSMFQFSGLMEPDGTLIEANQTALEFAGLEPGDVIGKPYWECYWWQLSSKTQAWLKAAIAEAAQGVFVRANVDVLGKNNRVATIDFSIKPIYDQDGEVVLLIPEGRDITEQVQAEQALRESEDRYRSLIETMAEGVLLVNAEGLILTCNPSAERILGYASDQLQGVSVMSDTWRFIRRDGHTMAPEASPIMRTLQSGRPCNEEVIGIRNPDDRVTWISINAEPLFRDREAKPYAAVVTFHDVTPVLQREEDLRQSRQRLRELTRQLHAAQEAERARLAREVHDVLGQSMTALRMDVRWLQMNGPDDSAFAERAQETMKTVESTIQTVRRISHELRPGVLDHFGLAAALEWQAEQFEQRAELPCQVEDATDGATEHLDRDLATALFRIFQEALTNVARHAEASSVHVRLAMEDDTLTLEIRDDGRGIRPEEIERSGSLGLLNMQERVIPWGGTVTVQGTPGEGTTVTVSVPLAPQPSEQL